MATGQFRAGVLHGDEVTALLNYANEHNFALPAVNVVGTNSINAVLETAKEVNSPVIIQFSNGGAAFYAGKGLSNKGQKASILGAISGAQHIQILAEAMVFQLFCIPTIAQRICYLGWMGYCMLAKNTLNSLADLYLAHICWIYQKNQSMKILKLVSNT